MNRLALSGVVLLALTYGALALHDPGALTVGTPVAKAVFVALLGASAAVYLLAVWLIRQPGRGRIPLWVVLAVAIGLRAGPLLAPPFLSSDMFRYVWDGRVQVAGINPYRYVPADPVLAPLRDAEVYPHINRAAYAPTIYPPAAQAIFAGVARVWPGVTGFKVVMVGFEALAVFCLLRLLALAGLPSERMLIYAWNPLPVWAFAGNGHVDAGAVGLIAVALLLRARSRDTWAGAALGAAILVKFLPAVVAPALWRRSTGWPMAVAAGLTMFLLYLPYVTVGWGVFGFLGGYSAEEGLDSGTGFWLLAGFARVVTLPPGAAAIYIVSVASILAVLGAWIAFVQRPAGPVAIVTAAGVMMAVTTVAISPHYPWYFAWLALPAAVAPYRSLVWLSAAPVLLYLDTDGDRFVWPSIVYLPALVLALADVLTQRPVLQPLKGST